MRIVESAAAQTIQTFLYENLGWKTDIDEQSFKSKIDRITEELRCEALDACIRYIENHRSNPNVIQALAREFSVGESYFFRDLDFFARLEHRIIPQIIQKNERSLAIWSVGCSRGEELYSVAMLLLRMIPDIESWNLYLLGTDVNPEALEKAEQGLFEKGSLRQIPDTYRAYFKPEGEKYAILPALRQMVHFKYHNIMSDPSSCLAPDGRKFDLIMVNNVLIYFEPKKATKAVNGLISLLREDGWLATTATEYGMGVFDFPHSRHLLDGYCIQKVSNPISEIVLPLIPIAFSIDFSENGFEPLDAMIDDLRVADAALIAPSDEMRQPNGDEGNLNAYYYDALKRLESGDNEGAKGFLRRCLYLDGSSVMAHIVLGNILKNEGKFEAAMKHINRAKTILSQRASDEEVPLSDGIRASDLLAMVNAIKGENFG